MTEKSLRKIIIKLLLMCYMLKNEYISGLHFKTQLKSRKTNHLFNDSKRRRMALSHSKKIYAFLRGITLKPDDDFYCLNFLHLFRIKKQTWIP